MSTPNLIGKVFEVIQADQFRILLEEYITGEPTNKFVLIEAKSIDGGVDHGTLDFSKLVKS